MKPRLALATFLIASTPAFMQPASNPPPAPGAAGVITPRFNGARPRAEYPVPYGVPKEEEIKKVVGRIYDYLAATTPPRVIDRETNQEITDFSKPNPNAVVERGTFNVIGYEWGVVYSGMLLLAENTGDARYRDYVDQRMKFIVEKAPYFRAQLEAAQAAQANAGEGGGRGPGGGRGGFNLNLFRSILSPRTLDDSGSMCAAMIKSTRAGVGGELRPFIDNYITWIHTKQERLSDGTLSRSRPLPKSLWLDDLYMSVPALAQMGKLTGEQKYFDDAVQQVTQFASRMFNKQLGIWAHGWVEGMTVHPEFHWGRANGWAIMAMTELLEVLPENHPGRPAILEIYRAHARGLAALQSKDGRWHQLLDRPDSYLETSATAIYAYSMARGVNRGWLDPLVYGPVATLAWHAVTTQVNDKGQVENVCVATGMGFDPAFYYFRPVSSTAPHGPGPVLLAAGEMLKLAKRPDVILNDEALMFGRATGM